MEKGELLSGMLCKKSLGTSAGSILHVLISEVSHQRASVFYSAVQTLVNKWLLIEGHSVGIWDTIADKETYKEIQDTICHAKVSKNTFNVRNCL